MGKPTICIGENKDADQLCGNREADQHLCFRYSDSTIPLLRGGSYCLYPTNTKIEIQGKSNGTTYAVFQVFFITSVIKKNCCGPSISRTVS